MIRGWMQHIGPTTRDELSASLELSGAEIDQTLLALETTGMIFVVTFVMPTINPIEWCERRLLARIHRLTLGKLRKEIAPVTAAQFIRWLLKWQHLAPGSTITWRTGLLEIIKQLQGFEMPANAWEQQILAKRC